MSPVPFLPTKTDPVQTTRFARRKRRQAAVAGTCLDTHIAGRLQHTINTQMNGIIGMLDMLQQTTLGEEQRAMVDLLQDTAENLLVESGRLLRWTVKDVAEQDAHSAMSLSAACRMLLIDADGGSQSTIKRELNARGIVIDCFATSATALTALTAAAKSGDPYRIVMLDQLPQRADGEALGLAIAIDPAHRDTLLILVSSDHCEQNARALAYAGFSAWLPREPSPSMLLGTLNLLCKWIVNKEAPRFISAGVLADEHTSSSKFRPFDGYRILAVDDNMINLKVVERMLTRLGCHVEVANGGEEALAMSQRQAYDLILMDCQMPRLDGYQTTALIRAAERDIRHTPIIGWSAHVERNERDTCLATGMDDFIAKPVRMHTLSALLSRWLQLPISHTASADAEPEDELDATQQMFGEDFAELVRLFLTDAPPRLAALQKLVHNRDHAAIAKLAHALCGSCASIGATALATMCKDLEVGARSDDIADASRLQAMNLEYARVDAKLRAMLLQGVVIAQQRNLHP